MVEQVDAHRQGVRILDLLPLCLMAEYRLDVRPDELLTDGERPGRLR